MRVVLAQHIQLVRLSWSFFRLFLCLFTSLSVCPSLPVHSLLDFLFPLVRYLGKTILVHVKSKLRQTGVT